MRSANSAWLCPISNGTTAEQDLAGTAALDSRQATGRGWVPRKVHDPHAAMTITSRKWDRLTKVIRERVGTAGKTASSRDLHLAAVALTQNADPVRPQIAQARAFVQGGGAR